MYDPPPERPSESDCCGTGCADCVFDVYDRECERWRRRRRAGGDLLRRDLLSATKYRPYRIVCARPLGDDVRAYTFAATPQAVGRLPVAYTQHVHIRLADGLSRPYTPMALGDNDCSFDVLVKAYPGGRFAGRLSEMAVDDVVTVRGPSGGVHGYDGYDSIVMFGGGTGVAAFVGLIGSLLDDAKCETLLRLHYSCKTLDGVLMRDVLAGYAAYWNCAVHIYLTRERDWSQCSKSFWYNENITEGRISQDCVARIIDKQQNLRTLWLICGDNEFNQYFSNLLQNYNITQDHIQLLDNTTKKFKVS